MSLPRFLDRVLDATVPALGAISRDAVREKLRDTAVMLRTGSEDGGGATEAGFLLAANLLARLYPVIYLDGPEQLMERARNEVTLINPLVELPDSVRAGGAFVLAFNAPSQSTTDVVVSASGWSVLVDDLPSDTQAATIPAALAAAAIGAGELFRTVFAVELGARGRHQRQPGTINLLTLDGAEQPVPDAGTPELGEFALVGAGAIGQAAAQTLALSGARGTMLVVDHESVTLSNLQRYVLARDSDAQAVKVDLLQSRLSRSDIDIVPIHARWHAALADRQRPTLVALDSAEDRMAVQAALPGAIYNAWTQPADVGWSRHEHFGKDPCLACLYLPAQRTPNLHEQIAAAFQQHPLRVLAYLARGLPVGLPLPPDGIPNALPGIPLPTDAQSWAEKPLLVDIAVAAGLEPSVLAGWEGRGLTDLYRDGVCGGALLHLGVGAAPSEVLVPLAHQSALAGVMLATQLIIARTPQLIAQRNSAVEGRYDVLAGLPQVLARPRARSAGCICGDSVYLDVYAERSGNCQPSGGQEMTERSVPHG